ncbi:membrane protein implicated in regulation of membrane protease activity [Friedmanniella endophytica]|uniref:Membrane protein implicated in regulation of membrane protease activity n=1 Tax=Microlunatus kandeliicorticis TaxID=1759536 RepID=A0A7W3ITY5_9ACTN|nr:hypothetical protein [Microlunatus kandeliicorticis]MBA8795203.1 membrane protein implicated in regulation of membrane protease activity [Microlunatus kandeliicorticis]
MKPVVRTVLLVVGVVMILVGLLWIGQGANLIPGSFMTGDPTWLVIGIVVAVAGVLLIVGSRGRNRRRSPR